MKILVTGKNGFLAKNVIEYYKNKGENVYTYSRNDDLMLIPDVDVVFHLAAVQRADNEQDFIQGNIEFTKNIIQRCMKMNKAPQIIFSSSTAVEKEGIFSYTKKEAEKMILEYGEKCGTDIFIFRLNHIYGKYGKPNFNNVVSTLCYNTAKGEQIQISDPAYKIYITYVDDVLKDFDNCLDGYVKGPYVSLSKKNETTIGELLFVLGEIKNNSTKYVTADYPNLKKTYDYFKAL